MNYKQGEMDYAPEEMSPFLATHKEALSREALSTLRVMAFLDPKHLHQVLFESLRQLFAAKDEDLVFKFPMTAAAHTEACAELVEASLIQRNEEDKALTMRPEIQTSVLADTHTNGLICPLFNAVVKTLTVLWPQMIFVPDRTVNQEEFTTATASGTDYENYLTKRHSEGRMPPLQGYVQYARVNVWGQRDELVPHIARLERIFYHLNEHMIKVCATITFAQLLVEASWYYMERSRYYDAEVKIQAALGVHELMWGKSRAHHASIYRVHAAIAIERGKPDEAAEYVDRQMEQLGLRWTVQGEELKQSGLLDRAPDAVPISPWGLDVPSGNLVVLPFRSICSFGWQLYLNAQDEKDPKYAQYLYEAELCFSTALKDSISAHDQMGQMNSRISERSYALGNVANKQASFLGKAHFNESLEHYENALRYFQGAIPDSRSSAGIAKTHYKLAIHFMRSQNYERATHHIDEAMQLYASNPAYNPHLARLMFQRSRIQTLTGDSSAKSTLHRAFAIRGRIGANDDRFAEELSEADFDALVGIWER